MSTVTTRTAELRPALLGGRALPAVRRMRVRVTPDGAVERTTWDGITHRVAAPGEATRVLLIDERDAQRLLPVHGHTGPVLALLGRDGVPLLALRLLDWAPPSWSTGATWREVVGVPALAKALELPVEPAESRDLPAQGPLRRVLLRPVPPRPWPGRAGPAVSSLALVTGFIALVGMGDVAGAVATGVALLLIGPLIVAGSCARAAARAAGIPPGVGGRTVVRPRPGEPTARGLVEATVQVGPDDVLLTDRGREVWLPGPGRNGVTRVVVEPDVIRLSDAAGNDYASLATALWAPSPEAQHQLAEALRSAGLDVLVAPLPSRSVVTVAAPDSAALPPRGLLSEAERGDASLLTPWLSGVAACLAVVTAIGATTWNTTVGLLLLAVAGILLGLRTTDMLRIRWADRRALRRVGAVTEAQP
jgi:hypothetical protein